MNLPEFIAKYDGKYIDFDGKYGAQCMDLYRQYVKEVLQVPQSPGVTGAADVWDTYLIDHYERVPNTPSGVPNPGDIIIWKRTSRLPYGHIAIFIRGDVNRFTSFDQNYPLESPCHEQGHTYSNIYGWLRPKVKMPDSGKIEIDKKTFEELVTKSSERDEYAKQFQSPSQAKQLIEQLKDDLIRANDSKNEQEQRAEEWRKNFNDLVASLATKLNTRQDYAEIIANVDYLIKRVDDLESFKKDHSEDTKKWEEKELGLTTELNRLKNLLNDQNVLANSELKDLIKELIRRFKNLLRGE